MCEGVPLFADNKKALFGVGTSSHATAADKLGIKEDDYRKYEYHWWEKEIVDGHYDSVAEEIVAHIDKKKSDRLVKKLVKEKLSTNKQLAEWIKKVPDEWKYLLEPKFERLAKMVNPKLLFYREKINKFKKEDIEKYNPYQATKLPKLEKLKKFKKLKEVGTQVWDQVGTQVWDQVWAQVGTQVGTQVWAQIRAQVRNQVGTQVWDQVWDQVGTQVWDQIRAQVRNQVGTQVGAQIRAASFWAIKMALSLPIKHWFFNWLKLGIIVVFVKGTCKVFGKKGMYLGEYNESDIFGRSLT